METKHSDGTSDTIEEMKKNNEISMKSLKWLVITFVVVGIIQIQIAVITLFFILRLD
jgi:ABC-type long-subunit fatty acid transport system fused permease/ATPase subunit